MGRSIKRYEMMMIIIRFVMVKTNLERNKKMILRKCVYVILKGLLHKSNILTIFTNTSIFIMDDTYGMCID